MELAFESLNRLNAPYGARCFLTRFARYPRVKRFVAGLNAPYGARCFLTAQQVREPAPDRIRLNAPYGARCFLTLGLNAGEKLKKFVLMHLMALGAF